MTTSPSALSYLDTRARSHVVHTAAVDYDDLLRLFTHRHTHALFQRQAAAFRQIAREKKAGLVLANDLDPVCRIMQLGLERLSELSGEGLPTAVFVKPLCSLVRLFGLPLLQSKAYEEFDNASSLASAMNVLVQALASDESELVHAVSQTVMAFTSKPSSREFAARCKLVSHARMVHALVLCLYRNSHLLPVALPLVTGLRHLASIPSLAATFDVTVFDVLVTLLEARDYREPLVLEVVQLTWRLLDQREDGGIERGASAKLERSPSASASKLAAPSASTTSTLAFASPRSIRVLSSLLRSSFESGHRLSDKAVRNDLMGLLLVMSRVPGVARMQAQGGVIALVRDHAVHVELAWIRAAEQSAALGATSHHHHTASTVGLGKIRSLRAGSTTSTIALSATQSVPPPSSANKAFEHTASFASCDEDFQFKLLAWALLGSAVGEDDGGVLSRTPSGAPSEALQVALVYLDAAHAWNRRSQRVRDKVAHDKALQNQAMTGVLTLTAGGTTLHASPSSAHIAVGHGLTPAQRAAALLVESLSYSQLLHLQSENLLLLTALAPRMTEQFFALSGIQRTMAFVHEIVLSTGGEEHDVSGGGSAEHKSLVKGAARDLQRRALAMLLAVVQAAARGASSCPLPLGSPDATLGAGVSTSFGRTAAVDSVAAAGEEEGDDDPEHRALQALLSLEGDEAYASVEASRRAKGGVLAAAAATGKPKPSPPRPSLGASSSSSVFLGLGVDPSWSSSAAADLPSILSVCLGLFSDATLNPCTRRDSLLVGVGLVSLSGTKAGGQAWRQARGTEVLAQFLANDGARVGAGLASAGFAAGGSTAAFLLSSTAALRSPVAMLDDKSTLVLYASKHPSILSAVIEGLWETVVPDPRALGRFVALDGVDLLLDTLVVVSAHAPMLRRAVLGLLADLLGADRSGEAKRFVGEWRAGPGRTLPVPRTKGATSPVGGGTLSTSSSSASLTGGSSLGDSVASLETEGFTALELLLSLWPEPDLLERNEVAAHSSLVGVEEEDDEAEEGENSSDEDGAGRSYEAQELAAQRAREAAERSLECLPRLASNAHLRPALYSVFARLGFGDDNPMFGRSTPVQRAQLYSIAHYVDTMRARTLAQVQDRLQREGIELVEEDVDFLRANAEHVASLDAHAQAFAGEQWQAQVDADAAEIDRYLHGITSRKEQNEAFLISSARRARKQTMKRRLMYKTMRAQMLLSSTDAARPSRQGKRPITSPTVAGSKQRSQANAEEKESDLSVSAQQQLDDDDDVELEQRLLAELDNFIPPNDGPIELASHTADSPTTASAGKQQPALLVSKVDSAADQALLGARAAQKERQATIHAMQTAMQTASNGASNSQRTNQSQSSQRTASSKPHR